ncbi:MAG TPA: hypothetical protein VLC48_00850 [Gemmatimonadota bacterium]|nr:hypothetical protein [Gemmatimonadota bacterium]
MAAGGKSEKKVERDIDKLLGASERLENRISDLEAGLTSLMDQQFDANVYRKALEHTVQEHVFTKIQKAVLIVGALGSIGFVVMARGFIKDQVDDAIKAQYAQFTEATDEAERTSLLLLLSGASGGNVFAQQTIRERMEELGPRLEKFISEPRSPQERELALDLYERESLPRLRDELLALFEDEGAPNADRRAALRVLLEDPNVDISRLLRGSQNAVFRREAAGVLAGRATSNPEIASFISEAARSDTSTLRSAVLFFVVNPALWDSAAYHQSLFPRSAKQRGPGPYAAIIDVATADALTEDLVAEVEEVESKGLAGLDSTTANFFNAHLALAFLRQGEPDRFARVLAQSPVPESLYPKSVWRGTILPLFPDALDAADAQQVTDPHELSLLVGAQLAGAAWSGSSYQSCSDDSSVERLTQGDLGCYVEVMNYGYYEPQRWLRSVLPLFPDYAAAGAGGDEIEQDQLWGWVERTDLEFDGAVYRCVDPAACRPVDLADLPTEGRTARAGPAVAGRLGAGDPLIVEGRSGQAWALEGRAGESYTIELRSSDFDAYLYLVGPGLAEPLFDDDGAGETHSRLAVRLPQTGTYRVIVSAYDPGGQGAYELQVQSNGR